MSRTLRVGCSGGDVAAVQDALNQIGANAALPEQQTALPLLVPDGAFGNKTYIRVKDFQSKNGLAQDGIVGPATLGRLQDLLPALHAGMSTSRPAGGVAGGGGTVKTPPSSPPVHPNPFAAGGKSVKSDPGSLSKTFESESKTS